MSAEPAPVWFDHGKSVHVARWCNFVRLSLPYVSGDPGRTWAPDEAREAAAALVACADWIETNQ